LLLIVQHLINLGARAEDQHLALTLRDVDAIRRKIEHFHAMNVVNDADTAAQLSERRGQISGLTGEALMDLRFCTDMGCSSESARTLHRESCC